LSINLTDLKESNGFLNVLFNNITSAIFIVDGEARIQNFNDSFGMLFQGEDFIGKLCGDGIGCAFSVEENKECGKTSYCGNCILRKAFMKSFTEKVPTFHERLERDFYISGKKIKKYFQYTTKYINYNNQEMVVIIVDDISQLEEQKKELKIQNGELIKLNDQKNELLGVAAHDLRNPIAVMQMCSETIMLDNANLNEDQKYFIDIIYDSSHFMLNLLSDILDISKIESGRLDLEKKLYDYFDVVKHNYELNKKLAAKKNIDIELKLVNDAGSFMFDKNKIEQVLNNLIGNAVKYSHPGTRVTVSVSREKNFVVTRISDEGQGIKDDEISNIFKPFHIGSTRSTAGEKSTGLGLAIVKKIVERHGGVIGVESVYGKGSTFFFRLPVNQKNAAV